MQQVRFIPSFFRRIMLGLYNVKEKKATGGKYI